MQGHQIKDKRVEQADQIDLTDQTEQGKASLKLPSEIGMCNVHDLKAEYDQLLTLSGQVHVDASQVIRADAAALQLLYTLIKQLAEQNRKVIWLSPSDALQQAAGILGLSGQLKLSDGLASEV